MFNFDLRYSKELPPGYTVLGTVDIPVLNDKNYLLLDFSFNLLFIHFSRKVAFCIT
jgi:hypothetical protein